MYNNKFLLAVIRGICALPILKKKQKLPQDGVIVLNCTKKR